MDRNLYRSLPSLPRSEGRELSSDLSSALSPFSHGSALYSPSNVLSTPDILPADPLPAAIYNLHSSSPEPNTITPESQQPLDEPLTVPDVNGHEPLARETLRLVPLRELVARPWARDCVSQTFPRSGHGQVESVCLSELTAQGNALSLHLELREHPEHRFQLATYIVGLACTSCGGEESKDSKHRGVGKSNLTKPPRPRLIELRILSR